MDLEKYRALLSAIENGSITAAAEELQFTPSGISRSIAAVEEELGFTLLYRGKNGVVPTAECEKLLPDIRTILYLHKVITQNAALIRGAENGSVTIGTAYPLYNKLLASMIVEFKEKHPALKISLIEGASSELCSQLVQHRLDMCIVSKRDNIPVFRKLTTDSISVWVPAGHPAVKKGVYHIKDIEKDDYIQIYPDMETDNSLFLQKNRLRPRICASTSDLYAAYSMVEAGLGVALVNSILADSWKGSAKALPIDINHKVEIGLASFPKDQTSPAAAAFMKFFEEKWKTQKRG